MRSSIAEYCETIGMNPMLVQGAGGNISWKDGATLWVKASGTSLANALKQDIFVSVDLPHLNAAIENGNFSVTPKLINETELRPSIETILHALIPYRVVVHLHAIDPLVYLVQENSESMIADKLKDEISWAMVKYKKPGEDLAKAVAKAISRKANVNVLLLENHGLVIGGETIKEVDDLLTHLLTKLATNVSSDISEAPTCKPLILSHESHYTPVNIGGVHNLALNNRLYEYVKSAWALYPDHVVFLGKSSFCYNTVEAFKKELNNGSLPEMVIIKDMGVFAKPEFNIAKKIQLQCYYDVLIRQPDDVNLKALDEFQIDELLNWDAEHYRQNVAKN